MNIGIIGAGYIAALMAQTLRGIGENAKCYAIAARDLERAKKFAADYGFEKAYGSYAELAADPDVDIVYIATPHSHHADCMRLCIESGKAVLCEKSFTKNAKEAREILDLAEKKGVLVTEAIWTRYMPSRKIINDVVESGIVGKVTSLSANLHYNIVEKERIQKPELAGGALLDVGVYTLNFALMHFGTEIARIESNASLTDTKVDGTNNITIYYKDGRTAFLNSGIYARSDRKGIFYGENGYIIVENINNPQSLSVFDDEDKLIKYIDFPPQITGYEYQVEETIAALKAKKLECESMPHKEIIRVMEIMDGLRKSWGVVYPGD